MIAAFAFRFGFDRLALFALDIRVDGLPAWRAAVSRAYEDNEDIVLTYVFPAAASRVLVVDEDGPIDLSDQTDPRVQ